MECSLDFDGRNYVVSGEESDRYFGIWRDLGYYGGPHDRKPFQIALRPNYRCLDIGANIGYTVILEAKACPHGKVIGFEPSPTNFEHLSRTVSLNGFDNVEIIQAAAGATRGSLRLNDRGPHTHAAQEGTPDAITVPMITIDDWLSDNPQRIDFVKIDVEGYERDVLLGMQKTLKLQKPIMFIEFNSLTTIMVGRLLPQDFLDQIMAIYPFVAKIEKGTGDLKIIGRDESSRINFISENLQNSGFLDDLMCWHDSTQIIA